MTIPNACAAASYAMGYSYEMIKNGLADAMLVVGSDSFARYTQAGFGKLSVISPDVPRPFSKNRQGMMPAEGSGAVLIESYEHAIKRNAKIYSEIVNYGMSCDAFHITQVNKEGLVSAYKKALDCTDIKPSEVSYISTHGTGTELNDLSETQALSEVFGDCLINIPINSIKSSIGHSMGAASAIECVVANLAIRDGIIPATMNFIEKDTNMPDIDVVPNKSRKKEVNIVFKTSSAFGGNNCVIIFKKI